MAVISFDFGDIVDPVLILVVVILDIVGATLDIIPNLGVLIVGEHVAGSPSNGAVSATIGFVV